MISELQLEESDFQITQKKDYWYIAYNNLEAGPFTSIPDHYNNEYYKLCDFFSLKENETSTLAKTLFQTKQKLRNKEK